MVGSSGEAPSEIENSAREAGRRSLVLVSTTLAFRVLFADEALDTADPDLVRASGISSNDDDRLTIPLVADKRLNGRCSLSSLESKAASLFLAFFFASEPNASIRTTEGGGSVNIKSRT